MKNKVLIFNGHYFPAKKYGGPATSIANMVESCSDEIEFYIIVANHDFGETKKFTGISEGWNSVGRAQVKYVDDNAFTVCNIRNWIKEIEPNSIYLSGIMSIRNLKYLYAARKENVNVIVPPRGELCENAIEQKKYKKIPFLAFLRIFRIYNRCIFHVTSQTEYEGVVKYLNIKKGDIVLIPNLPKAIANGHITKKNEGELHAVFVARICKTKNLQEALKALKYVHGLVRYDIYGPLEDELYWDECNEQINALPPNIEVSYYGNADAEKVQGIYLNTNCTIFPTVTENYGHSIVESLVAGCPCIIPKGTTPWDMIAEKAGYTYNLGDCEELANQIQRLIDMDQIEYNDLVTSTYEFARTQIESKSLINKYINLLTDGGKLVENLSFGELF